MIELEDGRARRGAKKREERRQRILDAAVTVFGEKGYHQTTVADVIEAADIARGTFYLYFDGKNAIFVELLDRLLLHLRTNVVGVDIGEGAPPVEAQLFETVRRIVETVVSNRALATILFRDAVGLDPEVQARMRAFYGRLHAFIADALELGRGLGVVRDVDVFYTASCILGSIKQVLDQHLLAGEEGLDVERVTRAIVEYNMRGLFTHPSA